MTRSVPGTHINGDMMSSSGQSSGQFVHVEFNAAEVGWYTLLSNESDLYPAGVTWRGAQDCPPSFCVAVYGP